MSESCLESARCHKDRACSGRDPRDGPRLWSRHVEVRTVIGIRHGWRCVGGWSANREPGSYIFIGPCICEFSRGDSESSNMRCHVEKSSRMPQSSGNVSQTHEKYRNGMALNLELPKETTDRTLDSKTWLHIRLLRKQQNHAH